MGFYDAMMDYFKFWELKKEFWDKTCKNSFQKVKYFRGGGVKANLEKVYILTLFVGPFPYLF